MAEMVLSARSTKTDVAASEPFPAAAGCTAAAVQASMIAVVIIIVRSL